MAGSTFGVRKRIAWAAVLLALALARSRSPVPGMPDFTYTHWLFSYHYEFVKRGLPGEVLDLLGVAKNPQIIYAISYGVFVLAAGALIFFFSRPWRLRQDQGGFLFFLLAATSAGTIQYLHYDVGRFDAISLLLALLAMVCIERFGFIVQALSVLLLMSAVILVHEANFVMFFPMVFMFWIYRRRAGMAGNLIRFGVLSCLLLVLAATLANGLVDTLSFDAYYQALKPWLGPGYSAGSLPVLFADLDASMALTWRHGFTYAKAAHHLALLAFLMPLGWLFYPPLKRLLCTGLPGRDRAVICVFLLCTLSPLALYPFGFDHFRWWAMAIINFFLVLALLMADQCRLGKEVSRRLLDQKKLVYALVAASFLLGPLSITTSFSNSVVHDFIAWRNGQD